MDLRTRIPLLWGVRSLTLPSYLKWGHFFVTSISYTPILTQNIELGHSAQPCHLTPRLFSLLVYHFKLVANLSQLLQIGNYILDNKHYSDDSFSTAQNVPDPSSYVTPKLGKCELFNSCSCPLVCCLGSVGQSEIRPGVRGLHSSLVTHVTYQHCDL